MNRKNVIYAVTSTIFAIGATIAGVQVSSAAQTPSANSVQHPIVIRMLMWNQGPAGDDLFIKNIVDPFEKSHPGIKVQMEFVNGSNLDTKALLEINSGHPPNLLEVVWDEGMLVHKGVLMPLSEKMKESHINPEIFLKNGWDSVQIDGQPYAMPASWGPAYALYYNPAAMKAAGLNPNKPPHTWKQLYADSVKAVKFDKSGNLQRIGFQFSDNTFAMWEGLFGGGDHFWKQQGNQLVPDPVNSYNINFLTYLKKLADLYGGYKKYSKWVSTDQGAYGSDDYFAQGKSLFIIDGNWLITQWGKYFPKFRPSLTYPPTPHGKLVEQKAQAMQGWNIGFPKGQSSEAFNAAWTFYNYAFVQHAMSNADVDNGATRSEIASWKKSEMKLIPQTKTWANFAPELKYFTDPVLYETQYVPPVSIAQYYQDQMTNAADAVLLGKATPKQALQQVAQNIQTQEAIGG